MLKIIKSRQDMMNRLVLRFRLWFNPCHEIAIVFFYGMCGLSPFLRIITQ